jgi:hypothetical protein
MHILMFVIWTCLGIFLIAVHATTDTTAGRLTFIPGHPSGGWLALILAAYNLLHWWASESMRKERQRLQMEEAERRERLYRERHARDGGQVDPNFQFTDDTTPRPPEEQPPA